MTSTQPIIDDENCKAFIDILLKTLNNDKYLKYLIYK